MALPRDTTRIAIDHVPDRPRRAGIDPATVTRRPVDYGTISNEIDPLIR